MPRRPTPTQTWLSRSIGNTIIGLLGTLIATGIVSMIALHSRVSTLTDDVRRTEVALTKHLEHAVDRDEWLRRDAQVQRSIDAMATKEDVNQLRTYITDLFGDRPHK